MKQRVGVCTNVHCAVANRKKKILITENENVCPACGSQLSEYKTSALKIVGGIILAFFILGLSIFIWQQSTLPDKRVEKSTQVSLLSPSVQEKTQTPPLLPPGVIEESQISLSPPIVRKPQLVPDSQCLLDRVFSDDKDISPSVLQIQQMLPMTLVPAVEAYPIAHDFRVWIKPVNQLTEPPFYIMRREVMVGEFKRYVETLSKEQQRKLGHDWQQDQYGTPLPDNYPVGSIPWETAKGYAQWLSNESGCILSLPTYHQWISAVVQFAQPDQAVIRQYQHARFLHPTQRPEVPDNVVDLLGNLREWSADDHVCPENGHYMLGEDYKTWLQYIGGEPICETMALDTIGFRLVKLSSDKALIQTK